MVRRIWRQSCFIIYWDFHACLSFERFLFLESPSDLPENYQFGDNSECFKVFIFRLRPIKNHFSLCCGETSKSQKNCKYGCWPNGNPKSVKNQKWHIWLFALWLAMKCEQPTNTYAALAMKTSGTEVIIVTG